MSTVEFALPRTIRSDRRSAFRWILSHVRRHGWLGGVAIAGALGNALMASAIPVLTGLAFNATLKDPPDLSLVGRYALLIIASQLIRGALQFGRNFGSELLGQRLERDIREELYLSLLGKSMTFHNLQPVGDTMARATNDVREINLMFNPGLNLVVGSANFLIIPLIISATYHPSLVLVPAVFVGTYALALRAYLRELSPISDEVRHSFGALNTHLSEALDGIEVVKGNAQEARERARFGANALAFRDAFVRQADVEARFLPLLLLGLATAAAFLHAFILFQQGHLNEGDVVAYMTLIQLFRFPTFISLFAYSQVSLGMAGARRILDLMVQETLVGHNPGGYDAPMSGIIEFREVDFSYQGSDESLEAVSFKISPGQTVAIVGQTGSGKTTLVKLINRTYDATTGQVLVDGIDVRDWNLASLRRQISIIEQDVFLFTRSLAENIAFGCPGAEEPSIQAAAQAAQADDFIRGFNEGYQTVVGERGVTLSGGQRQRIALARAFLTEPSVLILDDSTSSIDSETEDQIQRAIFRAAQGRTTIIITHRLSQIRWADLILVMRAGRIVAQGSHEALMSSSSAYRNIFSRYG
jgi:ATP-binding cassette subfamily B protein